MSSSSNRELPSTEADFLSRFSTSDFIQYAIIDAFSAEGVAFGGNAAAVVVLKEWKDEEWLQKVATEFNLSETAYILKKPTNGIEGEVAGEADEGVAGDEGVEGNAELNAKPESEDDPSSTPESEPAIHEYDLRWFTPFTEVDLCGHATLAAGHLLFHTGVVGKKDTIFFHTKSGILPVRCVGPKGSDAQTLLFEGTRTPEVDLVELNFPWTTSTPSSVSAVQALPGTLSDVEVVAVAKAANNIIVELASKEDVEKIHPEMQELLNCESDGLFATAPGGPGSGFDFVSRCFFPKFGVDEDPVTGSAHAALGPYWSTKLGKNELLAYQASKRGGTLALQLDKKIGRVYIRGQATVVMVGLLLK